MPLTDPIQFLKHVGPKLAPDFHHLGVETARDLLFAFPRRFEDRSKFSTIAAAPKDGEAVIIATVRNVERKTLRSSKIRSMVRAMFTDSTGEMEAIWFNAPWIEKQLVGTLVLYGKVTRKSGWLQMTNPKIEPTDDGAARASLNVGGIVPIYPLVTKGSLTQDRWRKIMRAALDTYLPEIPELYPPEFLRAHALLERRAALEQMHFPTTNDTHAAAWRRCAWDEALITQLLYARRRAAATARTAFQITVTPLLNHRIRALFPFRPTSAQNRVIAEISADLAAPTPMHRLLQGDVGSGKTAVAIYAMLAVISGKAQACMLAPTGLLARQHLSTLENFLAASHQNSVKIRLLTSGMKDERDRVKNDLQSGRIDILIATHAALQADVVFANLGLVVIDEQHKFGVTQREALTAKGRAPNLLVMTATPIPRSLAMTVYGDLEISIIDEMPPGRPQTVSTMVAETDRARQQKMWEFIRAELSRGRQAFIVSPRLEEGVTLVSAKEAFENFRTDELAGYTVGLLHGQMSRDEQHEILTAFRERKIQALVSTVVIEVGMDIPNATIMLVLHAERFGLAQLHQLRGRIGRGIEKSYFIMLFREDADDQDEAKKEQQPLFAGDREKVTPRKRLQTIVNFHSGFDIAEADLRFRGPGEFLGTEQHGMPDFKVLNLLTDLSLMQETRQAAHELLPELDSPRYAELVRETDREAVRLEAERLRAEDDESESE